MERKRIEKEEVDRKRRENEEVERKTRENEEVERKRRENDVVAERVRCIVFSYVVTLSPREIMGSMFKLQGIFVDPSSLEDVMSKIVAAVGSGYGNGIDKYDCFISYRVATNQDMAKELYFQLKVLGIHAFWDKACLKNGESWKDGFLNG